MRWLAESGCRAQVASQCLRLGLPRALAVSGWPILDLAGAPSASGPGRPPEGPPGPPEAASCVDALRGLGGARSAHAPRDGRVRHAVLLRRHALQPGVAWCAPCRARRALSGPRDPAARSPVAATPRGPPLPPSSSRPTPAHQPTLDIRSEPWRAEPWPSPWAATEATRVQPDPGSRPEAKECEHIT